jgi:hypothetical protein
MFRTAPVSLFTSNCPDAHSAGLNYLITKDGAINISMEEPWYTAPG